MNREAMRAACADLEDYLDQALAIMTEPLAESSPRMQAERAWCLAHAYIQLAAAAVDRYAEAARA